MNRAAPALKLEQIQTPVIPVMGELMRQCPGTLSLGQGMVSWAPPVEALQAAAAAVATGSSNGLHQYGPVQGHPELRRAVAQWLQCQHGIDLSCSEVLITAGSNMAFHALMQVLCDPGDEVILPRPFYFNHEMAVQLAGGTAVTVDAGVVPDPARLAMAITEHTRAIVTVSPNNPSGAVFPRPVLEAINHLCAQRGLLHICDEAYALFTHGSNSAWSPGSSTGSGSHTVTLGSLSKSHGMAGWRIGWAVVPQTLMPSLAKVQDTVLIHPPQLTQQVAIGALAAGATWCQQQIAGLQARRQQVLQAFEQMDASAQLLTPADGAFYAVLKLNSSLTSDAAMEYLIREHGVALVSGSSFGLSGCCLRLSYGMLSGDLLSEALHRLSRGLKQLR